VGVENAGIDQIGLCSAAKVSRPLFIMKIEKKSSSSLGGLV